MTILINFYSLRFPDLLLGLNMNADSLELEMHLAIRCYIGILIRLSTLYFGFYLRTYELVATH
jgi:hypothetical protein